MSNAPFRCDIKVLFLFKILTLILRPIRDALGPLKATLLSRSLENLQALVDDVFEHDEKKGIVIVEKVRRILVCRSYIECPIRVLKYCVVLSIFHI
jgi:hypothetical protein